MLVYQRVMILNIEINHENMSTYLKFAHSIVSTSWRCPKIFIDFQGKTIKFFSLFQDVQLPKPLGTQASVQFAASLAS
jgi:hypothetical protein